MSPDPHLAFGGFSHWVLSALLAGGAHALVALGLVSVPPPDRLPAPEGGFVIELADIPTARADAPQDVALGPDARAREAVEPTEAETPPEAAQPPPEEPDPVAEPLKEEEPPPAPALPPVQPQQEAVPESRTTQATASRIDDTARAQKLSVPDAEASRQTVSQWMHEIELALETRKTYPEAARRARAQGMVKLRLVIARDGELVSAAVVTSSGHSSLDGAAIDLVRQAAPFPPLPARIKGPTARLVVPLAYALK